MICLYNRTPFLMVRPLLLFRRELRTTQSLGGFLPVLYDMRPPGQA
jgi:hypothetical protein